MGKELGVWGKINSVKVLECLTKFSIFDKVKTEAIKVKTRMNFWEKFSILGKICNF